VIVDVKMWMEAFWFISK